MVTLLSMAGALTPTQLQNTSLKNAPVREIPCCIPRVREKVTVGWTVGAGYNEVILTVAEPVAPLSSVTTNVTTHAVRLEANVWLGLGEVEVAPSPKSQAYDVIVPSGSWEPAEPKLTARFPWPRVVEALMAATGARFAVVVTVVVPVAVAP
jgi:hypothetical protein